MAKAAPCIPAPVPLEANNGLSNLRGTVALARGDDPDSATADFFINLADNTAARPRRRTIPATPPAMPCSAR